MVCSLVKMMADHKHVEMLVNSVTCEGHRGIGGRGQYVSVTADTQYIWGVASPRPLRVVRVNCATLECSDCLFHAARLVKRVCVYRYL